MGVILSPFRDSTFGSRAIQLFDRGPFLVVDGTGADRRGIRAAAVGALAAMSRGDAAKLINAARISAVGARLQHSVPVGNLVHPLPAVAELCRGLGQPGDDPDVKSRVVLDALWFPAQDKSLGFLGVIGAHRSMAAVWEGAMFGLRRFRFRSPERNRESAERRFALIQSAVRTALVDAERESKGLRGPVAQR